jgi:hypothetical protein
MAPAICRNESANEMWASLLAKALAKYHGSFESLNGGDTGEALVDLTGGSCETLALRSKACRTLGEGPQGGKLWALLEGHLEDRHAIVVASVPTEAEETREKDLVAHAAEQAAVAQGMGNRRTTGASNAASSSSNVNMLSRQGSSFAMINGNNSSTGPGSFLSRQDSLGPPELVGGSGSGFQPGAGFAVLALRRVGEFGQFELVRLRSFFQQGGHSWKGDWGLASDKWAEVPEVGETLTKEGGVPYTEYSSGDDILSFGVKEDDGTFWMSFADFLSTFSKVHACKVFPDGKYKQFCVHGEWVPPPTPEAPPDSNGGGNIGSGGSIGGHSSGKGGGHRASASAAAAGGGAPPVGGSTAGGSLRLHPNDLEAAAACEIRFGGGLRGGGGGSGGSVGGSVAGGSVQHQQQQLQLPRSLEGLNYTEALLARGSSDHVVKVPNLVSPSCAWFTNPQYTLSLGLGADSPVSVFVSLLQEDRRTKEALRDNTPVGFTVVRSRPPVAAPGQPPLQGAPAARVWAVEKPGDVVFDSTKAPLVNAGSGWAPSGVPLPGSALPSVAAHAELHGGGGGGGGAAGGLSVGCGLETAAADATREVSCPHLVLSPGFVYTVVPHTERQGVRSRFVLRVFCPANSDVSVAAVPPPCSVAVQGAWARGSPASSSSSASSAYGSGASSGTGGGGDSVSEGTVKQPPVDTAGGPLLTVQTPPKKQQQQAPGGGGDTSASLGAGASAASGLKASISPPTQESALVLGANPKWCENPQFVLRLPRSLGPAARVEATIVVRRTGLKQSVKKIPAPGYAPPKKGAAAAAAQAAAAAAAGLGTVGGGGAVSPPMEVDRVVVDQREPAVGVVVAKVAASDDPAERRRRVKQENSVRTNALGEKLSSKESSLKVKPRAVLLEEEKEARVLAGLGGGEEDGGGSMGGGGELPPERKMVVSSKEWHLTSDYSNRAVAMLKLPTLSPSFCPDGLVVVPTLSEVGCRGSFSVEVLSDCPGLKLEPMPAGRATVLSGQWSGGDNGGGGGNGSTAGGNHMHRATWKKNPHFHLRLLSLSGRTKVKITLSRPAAAWKQQTSKDSLGCMLGFYVCKGPVPVRGGGNEEIYHEGEPWSETAFVPANSVSTPAEFELPPLDNEVYTITPCTFEPGKVGPFVLSVTADAEVIVTRDSGGGYDRK